MIRKSNSGIIDMLTTIEGDLDLYTFEVCGIPLWWFARAKVYRMLIKRILNEDVFDTTADQISIEKQLRLGMRSLKSIIQMYSQLKRSPYQPIVCLSSSNNRRPSYNGKDFDIFFDYLDGNIKYPYVILECATKNKHSKNPYSQACSPRD